MVIIGLVITIVTILANKKGYDVKNKIMDNVTRFYAKPDTYKARNTSVNAYLGAFKTITSLGSRSFYTGAAVFAFWSGAEQIVSAGKTNINLKDAFSGSNVWTSDSDSLWIVIIPGWDTWINKTDKITDSSIKYTWAIIFSWSSSEFLTWAIDTAGAKAKDIKTDLWRWFLDSA